VPSFLFVIAMLIIAMLIIAIFNIDKKTGSRPVRFYLSNCTFANLTFANFVF